MDYFGFGTKFIDVVKTTYTEFSACIQNNGYFSSYFPVTRSVHQGGPNSSFLFLLCIELLAIKIREDEELQGVKVGHGVSLLSQFADDMDVCLCASDKNLQRFFELLEEFRKITGFKINYDKTTVYRIGSLRDTDVIYYLQKPLNWTNDPINILGVMVSQNVEQLVNLNIDPLIEQSNAILRQWKWRNLSLIGRVMVINTLIASLFVYKLTVIPTPPVSFFRKMNELFRDFLWNGKSKIALHILQMNKEDSGLG